MLASKLHSRVELCDSENTAPRIICILWRPVMALTDVWRSCPPRPQLRLSRRRMPFDPELSASEG